METYISTSHISDNIKWKINQLEKVTLLMN